MYPPVSLAHPFDGGHAATLEGSLTATSETLGSDARAYQTLFQPLIAGWPRLAGEVLGPLRLPHHPLILAASPGTRYARRTVSRPHGFNQCAPRISPVWRRTQCCRLSGRVTAAFGLILGVAGHAGGWPLPRGRAQRISDALAASASALSVGGDCSGTRVESLDALPPARVILCGAPHATATVTPCWSCAAAGLPRARVATARNRPRPSLSWALARPIPWAAPASGQAACVHLGGTLGEIAVAERAPWRRSGCRAPFCAAVTAAEPFDPTRAPPGRRTAWAYCHVPHASHVDMVERIQRQMSAVLPGFSRVVLARSVLPPLALEQHNANLVGGDINGGVQDLWQLFTRPTRHILRNSGSRSVPLLLVHATGWGCSQGCVATSLLRAALRALH